MGVLVAAATLAIAPAPAGAELATAVYRTDGVDGRFSGTTTNGVPAHVWDIEVIGNTAYVAGKFQEVVQSSGSWPHTSQPHLAAFDASSGSLLWERILKMRALAAPALTEDGLFLVLGSGKLQRRDPANGDLTWESELPGLSETAPVVGADLVFLAGEGFVAAFDRTTGALTWTLPVDGEVTQLSIDGDSLFVATAHGFLHRLISSE